MKRICILAQPRTGSQWCEALIDEHLRSTTGPTTNIRLNEIFEPYTVFENYYLDQDQKICYEPGENYSELHNVHRDTDLGTLNSLTQQRLDMIRQARADQPMVLRQFIRAYRPREVERELVRSLADLGFEFIALTRDFRSSMLSYLLASTIARDYGQNIWFMGNRPRQTSYRIPLEHPGYPIEMTSRILVDLHWEAIISDLVGSSNWHSVDYSTMLEDLSRVLGGPVRDIRVSRKTLTQDPYSYIENADEVRTFIENYALMMESFKGLISIPDNMNRVLAEIL